MAFVLAAVADLRGEPRGGAELVDQLHYKEITRVLGERDGWLYVVAQDGYFGWLQAGLADVMRGSRSGRRVAAPAAPVHAAPDRGSEVLGHVPAGTRLTTQPSVEPGWIPIELRRAAGADGPVTGYIAAEQAVALDDLPHRYPSPADLIATAEAFLGTPYLWGGTSALGVDCSGLVQQVYRLNGVGLPRDAHQQALAGRSADRPRAGDLLFFGSPKVTHVGMYVEGGAMIHAPQRGAFVERRLLSELALEPVSVRRYLAEVP